MVNYDLVLLVVFGFLVLGFMLLHKKRTSIQKIAFPFLYIIIYRTKLGLKSMDKLANKFPRTLNILSYISIVVGFLGMAFILFFLLKGAYDFFFLQQPSPVGLVLPGVEAAPGLPILSFWHWLIAIFILATVHEFSHGVFARLNNIKIKSSGFALLGILLPIVPAAFVEPDEKKMAKAPKKAQLAILSAGSFSNFLTAIVSALIFLFLLAPVASNMLQDVGVKIVSLEQNGPATLAGININESISNINGVEIKTIDDFTKEMSKYSPYERVSITTDKGSYSITLGEAPSEKGKAHLGVYLVPKERIYNQEVQDKYGLFTIKSFLWVTTLFSWLFIINLGVGMFNLLPLGMLDGGKMFYLGVLHLTKNNESLTKRLWGITNMVLILLLLVLILPQLYKTLLLPLVSLIL